MKTPAATVRTCCDGAPARREHGERGAVPLIRIKPSAFKTEVKGLIETLGFLRQFQIRDGWRSLGDGGFQKKVS